MLKSKYGDKMNSISLIKKIMSLGIALIITSFIYTSINNAKANSVSVDIGNVRFKLMESTNMDLSVSGNTWSFDVGFDVSMKFNDKVKVEFNEDCNISVTDKVVITISLLPELSIDVPSQVSHGCSFGGTFSVKSGGDWTTINPEDFMDGSNYFGVQMILEMVPKSSSKAEVKIKGYAHVGPSHTALEFKEELTVFSKTINM